MTSATFTLQSAAVQECRTYTAVFQHPLVEEPPTSSSSRADQRTYAMLARKAENLCAGCPLRQQCLYDAVVRYDVAGIAGGTTARQRLAIRRRLGITVAPEDFDSLAGTTGPNRHVDHDEVVRLRQANPHESLETLARRLGCSLSTVKRHLRRHRSEAQRPRVQSRQLPSLAEVMAAARAVLSPVPSGRAA